MPPIIKNLLMALGVVFLAIIVLFVMFSSNCDYRVLAASTSPGRINHAKYEIRQCSGKSTVTAYIGVGPLDGSEGRRFTSRSIGTYQGSIDDASTGWPTLTLSWKNDYTLVLEAAPGEYFDFYGDELNGVSIQVAKP